MGRGRHVRRAKARRGDRTSESRGTVVLAHESRVRLRAGASGEEPARSGESGREAPEGAAPADVGERTRKEATARESGYGSPGRESSAGELQGRERHGTRPRSVGGHGERRGPKGLERAASQPEPSRGARTLRTAPTRVWRSSSRTGDREGARDGEGAPDVDSVRGSKNLTRGGPARSWNGPVPS